MFSQKIIDQKNRDAAVCALLSKMDDVYVFLTNAEVRDIRSMKEVVERISQQTLECSYFIREYAQNEKFRKLIISGFVNKLNAWHKERGFSRILFRERTSACRPITRCLTSCGNNFLRGPQATRWSSCTGFGREWKT